MSTVNPLLVPWQQPLGLPPFASIDASHFAPAFSIATAQHLAEVTAIASDPAPATFENTVRALDRAGRLLQATERTLSHLCASATSPALQAVEREMAPVLSAHGSAIAMMPGLLPRVDAVYAARGELGAEAARLTERTRLEMERAGARLVPAQQARLAAILEELSTLMTTFSQNVLADEAEHTLKLSLADLEGCPDDLIAAARAAALERGAAVEDSDAHVVTLSRSFMEPFLTYSTRRDLRERAWRAWTRRGELTPERDNKELIKTILTLRAEQASLHGFPNFAAFQLDDTMARTPARVQQLLAEEVWPRARASAEAERAALITFSGLPEIEPWDWRFYAEGLRLKQYDFDDAALKPYMSLSAVTRALFDTVERLYGLRFTRREDLQAYHEDVIVYEVREATGEVIGLFAADNFARPNKQGGAWMSELRVASRDGERVLPIIFNNNNFTRGGAGGETLLTMDDAVTLFHEAGHGLHGLLSRATFAGLAGTSVLRDFVELPSQLMEHWIGEPAVLHQHARHVKTGEPVPEAMLAKLKASRTYGMGMATVEYASCALLDQRLHALPAEQLASLDIAAMEASVLQELGMPQGIILRHRPAHFSHLFASSGYAAAYYCYLWAEVLDADAFQAFKEAGDIYDPATAARVREHVYSAGNTADPGELYRKFRGRDPGTTPMLIKKGLIPAE